MPQASRRSTVDNIAAGLCHVSDTQKFAKQAAGHLGQGLL